MILPRIKHIFFAFLNIYIDKIMVSVSLPSFVKKYACFCFQFGYAYDLRKMLPSFTVVCSLSIQEVLIGLWGFLSLIYSEDRLYASLIDSIFVLQQEEKKKVFLGVLERSVKAPEAEQTGQDNTLSWCSRQSVLAFSPLWFELVHPYISTRNLNADRLIFR